VIVNPRTPAKAEHAVTARSTIHLDGSNIVPKTIDIDGVSIKPSNIGLNINTVLCGRYMIKGYIDQLCGKMTPTDLRMGF
jgi:isopropylmalate/homocitrate/citramalate synthase